MFEREPSLSFISSPVDPEEMWCATPRWALRREQQDERLNGSFPLMCAAQSAPMKKATEHATPVARKIIVKSSTKRALWKEGRQWW